MEQLLPLSGTPKHEPEPPDPFELFPRLYSVPADHAQRLQAVCRGCLRPPVDDPLPLEIAPPGLPPLGEMLADITRLRPPPGRPLPQRLCRPCAQALEAAYAFRRTCLESHKRLSTLLDHYDCRLPPPIPPNPFEDVDFDEPDPNFFPLYRPPLVTRVFRSRACQTQTSEPAKHCTNCTNGPVSSPVKRMQCPRCDLTFAKKPQFKKHMIERHNVKRKDVEYPQFVTTYSKKRSDVDIEFAIPVKTSNSPIPADIVPKTEPDVIEELLNPDDIKQDDDDEEADYDNGYGNDDGYEMDHSDFELKDDMDAAAIVDVEVKIHSPPDVKPTIVEDDDSDCTLAELSKAVKINYEKTKNGKKAASTTCSICDKTFNSKFGLKRHLATHDDVKPYRCQLCGKSFKYDSQRKRHTVIHETVKRFKCDFCNRGFHRKDNLQSHMRVHGDRGADILALRVQVPRITKKNPKTFFCSICNMGFVREKTLKKHMTNDHGEKKALCGICGAKFYKKWQLNEHAKSHQNVKCFLCTECGQGFNRKDYLIIHMRRHSGDNPYKCKYCNKGFPRQTDVKSHEKYHANVKNHVCNVCGMAFVRPYSLKVHERVHTGEKPYVCKQCGKSFAQAYDMKLHMRRHTGERLNCEVCNKEFIQAYLLRQHKKSVHGITAFTRFQRLDKMSSYDNDNGSDKLVISTDDKEEC